MTSLALLIAALPLASASTLSSAVADSSLGLELDSLARPRVVAYTGDELVLEAGASRTCSFTLDDQGEYELESCRSGTDASVHDAELASRQRDAFAAWLSPAPFLEPDDALRRLLGPVAQGIAGRTGTTDAAAMAAFRPARGQGMFGDIAVGSDGRLYIALGPEDAVVFDEGAVPRFGRSEPSLDWRRPVAGFERYAPEASLSQLREVATALPAAATAPAPMPWSSTSPTTLASAALENHCSPPDAVLSIDVMGHMDGRDLGTGSSSIITLGLPLLVSRESPRVWITPEIAVGYAERGDLAGTLVLGGGVAPTLLFPYRSVGWIQAGVGPSFHAYGLNVAEGDVSTWGVNVPFRFGYVDRGVGVAVQVGPEFGGTSSTSSGFVGVSYGVRLSWLVGREVTP